MPRVRQSGRDYSTGMARGIARRRPPPYEPNQRHSSDSTTLMISMDTIGK